MIYPSPHDTDDPTNSSDRDEEPEETGPWSGLVDDTDYGDGQPSAHLPDARVMSRMFTGRLFEAV